MAQLSTVGLKPLDATGLKPAPSFDVSSPDAGIVGFDARRAPRQAAFDIGGLKPVRRDNELTATVKAVQNAPMQLASSVSGIRQEAAESVDTLINEPPNPMPSALSGVPVIGSIANMVPAAQGIAQKVLTPKAKEALGRAAAMESLKAQLDYMHQTEYSPADQMKIEGPRFALLDGKFTGMLAPGNIDINARPVLKSGSDYRTENSISIGTDSGEVLIPTVVDGKQLSDEEAIAHYQKTGQNLGAFDTPENADAYAQALHDRQSIFYGPDATKGAMNYIDVADGSLAYYLSGAIGSVAEMAPGLALSILVGNPLPAVAAIGLQQGGQSYAQARQQGLDPQRAREYAALYSAAEAIPEYIPLHIILKPGQHMLSRVVKGALSEGIEEVISQFIEIGIDKGYLDQNMTWGEALTQMRDAGIMGAIAGGVMGGAVDIAQTGMSKSAKALSSFARLFPQNRGAQTGDRTAAPPPTEPLMVDGLVPVGASPVATAQPQRPINVSPETNGLEADFIQSPTADVGPGMSKPIYEVPLPETSTPTAPAAAAPPAAPAAPARTDLETLLSDKRPLADILKERSTEDTSILRKAGYTDQQIADMSEQEVAQEAAQARVDGVSVAQGETVAPVPDGTKAAPVPLETPQDVQAGTQIAAPPTPAQAEAGNYQKRHATWNGLDIAIETEQGQQRTGTTEDGQTWSVTMPAPYGYINRSTGADGDHVDVYVGPDPASQTVFVVDQINPGNATFDEHKVFIGFDNQQAVTQTYHAAFSDQSGPSRLGAISPMSVDEFKTWLKGNTKRPVSYRPPPHAGLTPEQYTALRAYVTDTKKPLSPERVASAIGITDTNLVRSVLMRIVGERNSPLKLRGGNQIVRRPVRSAPASLLEFIGIKGGIRDQGGELRARDFGKVFIPGIGKILRKNGLTLDRARELAQEAGYIGHPGGPPTTINDFLAALDTELRGTKQFAPEDQAAPAQSAANAAVDQAEADIAAVSADITKIAANAGYRVTNEQVRAAAEMVVSRETDDPTIALETVIERDALDYADELAQTAAEKGATDEFAVPFDIEATDRTGQEPQNASGQATGAVATAAPGSTETRQQSQQDQGPVDTPEVDAMRETVARDAAPFSDPVDVALRAAKDPVQIEDALDKLRVDSVAVDRTLMRKYGAKTIGELEDAPLSDAERNFLFYSDAPVDRDRIGDLSRMTEPVGDMGEATIELRRAAANLPEYTNIDQMDHLDKVAVGRLLFLGSEIERLGGDPKAVILDAVKSQADRYVDPNDAEYMALDTVRRLGQFIDLDQVQQPKTPVQKPKKIAAPAAPTAEPGIQGKPQLVIPGAERASDATMAQRGADKPLTPKVDQKPADQGIFGDEKNQTDLVDMLGQEQRQPAPTTESRPRTLKSADGGNQPNGEYKSLGDFEVPAGMSLGRAARVRVLELGKQNPLQEFLVSFDEKGALISYGKGVRRFVAFSPAKMTQVVVPESNLAAHHNHPSSSSFSNGDIEVLTYGGIATLWAHGNDGSLWYRADAPLSVRQVVASSGNIANRGIGLTRQRISLMLESVTMKLEKATQQLVYDVNGAFGQGSKEVSYIGNQIATHARSLAFSKAGLFRYETNYEFPPEVMANQTFVNVMDEVNADVQKWFDKTFGDLGSDRGTFPDGHIGNVDTISANAQVQGAEQRSAKNETGGQRQEGDRGEEAAGGTTALTAKTATSLAKQYLGPSWFADMNPDGTRIFLKKKGVKSPMSSGTLNDRAEFIDTLNGVRSTMENPPALPRGAGLGEDSLADRNLYIAHNLKPSAVLHAAKMGGLPMPSLAITRVDRGGFENFGEISLIGSRNLIDPARSKTNKIYNADAYSPRYPQVDYQIDDKAFNPIGREARALMKEMGDERDVYGIDISRIESNGPGEAVYQTPFQALFLKDIGKFPKIVKRADGKPDWSANRAAVEMAVRKRQQEFENWVDDTVAPLIKRERIFKGFTYSGNRRYVDHTIENVYAEMKSRLKDGENWFYGAASIRSRWAKVYKSIRGIQQDRDKITTTEAMKEIKESFGDRLVTLLDEMRPYYKFDAQTFGYMDDAGAMLGEMATKGPRVLSEGFENIPPEIMTNIRNFLSDLVSAPTEYFEVKMNRIVKLNEFEAAIVPKGTMPRVVKALENAGLQVMTYDKKQEGARTEAIKKLDAKRAKSGGVLFQKRAAQTETPEFKRWFGDSKVVDAEGKPLIVYHGTNAEDFNSFDKTRIGGSDFGASGRGFYFTQDTGTAAVYAQLAPAGGTPRIVPVFLSMQKPFDATDQALMPRNMEESKRFTQSVRERGYDGIIVRSTGGSITEAVVFEPAQIKSVYNRGTFDPNDPRINFQRSSAQYPLAPRSEWYGEANYENAGGRLVYMTPDEFLARARPLKIDETSRENINDLKRHIESGRTLDPLKFFADGKEDGRHRAVAAKELGIIQVPVIEFSSTPSFNLNFTVTFTDSTASLERDLRKNLDAIGLGHVGLNLQKTIRAVVDGQEIAAEGMYFRNVITLALDSTSIDETFHHETLHGMRRNGLFTDAQWSILEKASKQKWREQYGIDALYAGSSDTILTEEGVAFAYQKWATGQAKVDGRIARLFKRISDFIEAIGNALRGLGFNSVESIFKDAKGGRLAAKNTVAQRIEPRFQKSETNSATPPALRNDDWSDPVFARAPSFWTRQTGTILARVQEKRLDKARIKTQDKVLPILRVQQAVERESGIKLPDSLDVYAAEANYHGRAGERLIDFREKELEPLVDEMKKRGIDMQQLGDFLYARHAQERNAAILKIDPKNPAGSGMTDAEAQRILNGQGAKTADFVHLANMVDAIIKESRLVLLRGGLITPEENLAWRNQYQHYVPLRGWEATPENDFAKSGRGFDVRGKEAKQALGRRSKADNPLGYVVLQAQQAIIRSEKNRVGKTLLRLAQAHPDESLWKINPAELKRRINPTTGLVETYAVPPAFSRAENLFSVKVGGKVQWIELKYAPLARAMRGVGVSAHIPRIIQMGARIFSALQTAWNPGFILRNMTKDAETALVNIMDSGDIAKGVQKKILKDLFTLRSIRGALEAIYNPNATGAYATWFDEYRKAGGKISFLELNSIEDIKRSIEKDLKGHLMPSALRAMGEAVNNVNTAVENGVRLSAYKALRENGVSQTRAAFIARELTVNFNRHGEWGPWINVMYIFFNASTQGTVRLAIAAGKSAKVRRSIAGFAVAGALLDFVNSLVSGDDDDGKSAYDNIPAWIKSTNMIIMIPGTKNYIMMPLAYGYNAPFVAGQQAMAVIRGATSPVTAGVTTTLAFVDAFSPLGTSPTFAQFISPTLLDPFVQQWENVEWYGGPIEPTKFDKLKPESENFYTSAPKWMIDLSREMNKATGGSVGRSGLIDISPSVMEHYANFILGGAGKFALNWISTTESAWIGEEILPEKVPFLRSFYGSAGTAAASKQNFYTAWDEVQRAQYELKAVVKAGDAEKAKQIRQDYQPELRAYAVMNQARQGLTDLRKLKTQVENDPKLSRAQRTEKLATIEQREKDIVAKSIGIYQKLKDGAR